MELEYYVKNPIVPYEEIFYTVPYINKRLIRNADGTKTILKVDHPKSIWSPYITERNTKHTPVMAAIAKEDFIGVDIDSQSLFEELLELITDDKGNVNCTYVAQSMPASAYKGGHFLFAYDKNLVNLLSRFKGVLRRAKIDIQIGNTLIYLATEGNYTKQLLTEPISSIDDLTPMPYAFLNRLLVIGIEEAGKKGLVNTNIINTDYTHHFYGYLLDELAEKLGVKVDKDVYKADEDIKNYNELKEDYISKIVLNLTPSNWAHIDHPNKVPRGNGTEWIRAVRYKLMRDCSVSKELFIVTLKWLYSIWDPSRKAQPRKDYDIIRDLESAEFCYDPDWREKGLRFKAKRTNDTAEVLIDPALNGVIWMRNTDTIYRYKEINKLKDAILALSDKKLALPKKKILTQAANVTFVSSPHYAARLSYNEELQNYVFNTYRPSEGVRILQGVQELSVSYKKPKYILKFLENLFPTTKTREMLLSFLAHKYRTFSYSPLYFLLTGVGGAGKGVFVDEIISYFSNERVISVTTEMLFSQFNAWTEYCDWLYLDEVDEGTSSFTRSKVVATLKRITGRAIITIQNKGKDIDRAVKHTITPIITTNLETKFITDTTYNDRRLVVFRCPNKMKAIDDIASGRLTEDEYLDLMRSELPHFAKYLSDLEPMDTRHYSDSKYWRTSDYYDVIEASLTQTDKVVDALQTGNFTRFIELIYSNDNIDALRNLLRFSTLTEDRLQIRVPVKFSETFSKRAYNETDLYTYLSTIGGYDSDKASRTLSPHCSHYSITYLGLRYNDKIWIEFTNISEAEHKLFIALYGDMNAFKALAFNVEYEEHKAPEEEIRVLDALEAAKAYNAREELGINKDSPDIGITHPEAVAPKVIEENNTQEVQGVIETVETAEVVEKTIDKNEEIGMNNKKTTYNTIDDILF